MSTPRCVWLVAFVASGLLVVSDMAQASDLPTRRTGEEFLEQDPWRPDTNDSGRAQVVRGQQVVPEADATPPAGERVQDQAWYRALLRFLQLRYYWGVVR